MNILKKIREANRQVVENISNKRREEALQQQVQNAMEWTIKIFSQSQKSVVRDWQGPEYDPYQTPSENKIPISELCPSDGNVLKLYFDLQGEDRVAYLVIVKVNEQLYCGAFNWHDRWPKRLTEKPPRITNRTIEGIRPFAINHMNKIELAEIDLHQALSQLTNTPFLPELNHTSMIQLFTSFKIKLR